MGACALAIPAAIGMSSGTHAQDTSTWDAIMDRGTLRVGVTQAPPWFFNDPTTNEWTGLGSSVGKAMANELGVEFEPVEVTWGTAVAAL